MKGEELEKLLIERCKTFNLKQTAFNYLEQLFLDNDKESNFLCGFNRDEIKTIFDRFEFQISRRHGSNMIRTRIGLYIENNDKTWADELKPIGFYELETNFDGIVLDDWFVLEKEKLNF